MSFYFDDDDEGDNLQPQGQTTPSKKGQSQLTTEEAFYCENCGGKECYMDETTGALVCTECFTQSQKLVSASQQDLEVDDGEQLVATTKTGHLVTKVKKLKKGPAVQKKLEDYDQTLALPDVNVCIQGMQRVLRETGMIVSALCALEEEETRILLGNVRDLWLSYLQSWFDGAEYYGSLYPEIRFCFRDLFLDRLTAQKLNLNLTFISAKQVRNQMQRQDGERSEGDKNSGTGTKEEVDRGGGEEGDRARGGGTVTSEPRHGRGGRTKSTCKDKTANRSDRETQSVMDVVVGKGDDSVLSNASELTGEQPLRVTTTNNNNYKKKKSSPLVRMLLHHHKVSKYQSLKVGRRAAALLVRPSMKMVAGILLIAASTFGITECHIRRWIGNGSLPLLNAFQLLSRDEQAILKPVASFFRAVSPPPIVSLKSMVATLQVACGFRPRKIVATNMGNGRETASSKRFRPGRLLSPSSVPVTTARLVADLGFGQTVLDYTLALMGLPIIQTNVVKRDDDGGRPGTDPWLPEPLKRARPDRLLDPVRILGVIVVACKLLPGWEGQSFWAPNAVRKCVGRSCAPAEATGNYANGADRPPVADHPPVDAGDDRSEHKSKRQRSTDDGDRFVPWSQNYLRFISNGDNLSRYTDFLERNFLDTQNSTMPKSTEATDRPTTSSTIHEHPAVRQPGKVAGHASQSPKYVPSNTFRCYETTQNETAATNTSPIPTPTPLHLLIEYVAYKTEMIPDKIFSFVAELDQEMTKHGRAVGSYTTLDTPTAYNMIIRDK